MRTVGADFDGLGLPSLDETVPVFVCVACPRGCGTEKRARVRGQWVRPLWQEEQMFVGHAVRRDSERRAHLAQNGAARRRRRV